ncbi:hypothetical protein F4806DRAFT_443956 [Annulohypoxylon nitens]|nr:hypothetical protein F4806DRAFT_443956 [Annulohypoxylon nitens]
MRDLAEEENGESEQYDILMAIRGCLKEYNEALIQVLTISQAKKPKDRDIKELRQWLIRPSMGGNFLVGIEADVWKDEYAEDFISPTSEEIDSFDSFLTGPVLDAYHWLYGHKKKNLKPQDFGQNLRLYDDQKITRFADMLSVVLSSLLPTVMILALYFIQSMLWRIGAVIIFTAIFAVALTVFTNARKIEVYSATAAFAAVEVVFIGSTANSS